jgi:Holliday junction resolvase RusA-like endonuclease
MHWAQRRNVNNEWAMLVRMMTQNNGNLPVAKEPCEIVITWNVARQMDLDNSVARAKPLLDALKSNGIISDDNPRVVSKLTVLQNIVARDKQGVAVEVMSRDVKGQA